MCSTLSWVLAALMLVGLPKCAHADFINLVSQSYHIHQRAVGLGGGVFDFEQTSPVPISHSASGGIDGGGYIFAATTNGGVTPDSAFVTLTHTAMDTGNDFVTAADTSAAITFRPLVSNLLVQTGATTQTSASVLDDTAGLAILTFPPYPSVPSLISLNLDHLYTMSALASTPSGGSLNAGVTLRIAPANIPESEGTLTFLVVGLGSLFIVARAQMFRPSN
jgi:hypothetical protein